MANYLCEKSPSTSFFIILSLLYSLCSMSASPHSHLFCLYLAYIYSELSGVCWFFFLKLSMSNTLSLSVEYENSFLGSYKNLCPYTFVLLFSELWSSTRYREYDNWSTKYDLSVGSTRIVEYDYWEYDICLWKYDNSPDEKVCFFCSMLEVRERKKYSWVHESQKAIPCILFNCLSFFYYSPYFSTYLNT